LTDLVARLRLETTGGGQAAGEIRQVESALDQIPASAAAAGASFDRLSASQQAFVAQYSRGASAFASDSTKVAGGARLAGHEILNLSRNIADVGVSAAMNMNPLMILIQQGPQIADVFQQAAARGVSFKSALGELGGMALSVLGRGGPILVGVGVLGMLVAAFVEGSNEAADFQNTLAATGNYAGLTAQAYEDMAARISKATGESVRTSKAGISQLVATGQFSAATIEKMTLAAERYSQLTGKSTQEILKDYAGMSQGVTDWAVKHALAHHDLTLAQIKYIEKLEKSGQAERAYQQAMDDINASIQGRAVPAYGLLERTLHDVAAAASNMWDKLLGIGRPDTIEGQIEKAKARLAGLNSAYNSDLVKSGQGENVLRARRDTQLHLDLLQFNKAGIDQAAAAEAKRAQEEADKIRNAYPKGSKSSAGKFDGSDMAIEAAARAELQARMALTKNVEQVAALKLREIDAEQAIQRERVQRQVKEGSITKAAAKTVLAKQAEAAALQRELVRREEAAGIAARELERRQSIGGLLDRQATAEAAAARTASEANRIELAALNRRQALERDALAEKNRQAVQEKALTEAEAFALAVQLEATQQAERDQTTREQRARLEEEALRGAIASRENQVDLLASEGALLKSRVARNRVELQILKAQHDIERVKLQEVAASANSSKTEVAIAEARLRVLDKIQANEVKLLEQQTTLLETVTEATDAVAGLKNAFRRGDWARALAEFQRTIETAGDALRNQGLGGGLLTAGTAAAQLIGGRTGRVAGTSLGIAGFGLGVGTYAGTAAGAAALGSIGLSAGLISGIAAAAPPIAAAAAVLYAAAKIFNIGGKPSNKGAGVDLVTGQVTGDKRDQETESAARKAAETILGIQDALKSYGLDLKTTINGLVLGTRDPTQIYTSTGKTLTSAKGDVGAAVDTALKALIEGATFQSEAQKKLVESLVATGKGFDAINEALASYAAAQKIPQQINDAILQLTDPKAFAIEELKRAQEEQRKALKAAADAGYITAEVFAEASAKLATLEGLQLAEVMNRFSDAVNKSTEELEEQASRLRGSIVDRILELTDPAAYRVKRVNDDINARISEAQPLIAAGVLGEEFLSLAEQLRALELAKLAEEIDGTTKAFQDARPRLLSWLDQVRAGPASETSARAQREEALRQYQRELAKAQGGDAAALGSITSYADRLIEADRSATSSASARLALRNQVLGEIEGLAGRGAQTPAQAIAQLQAPLAQLAQASAAELAALTPTGKAVVIANLPSMQAMYGQVLTGQTDRLVAANDQTREEIVAAVKALAVNQEQIFKAFADQLHGALADLALQGAAAAADQVALLQAQADELRLLGARARADRS
jgi:phage-related minor tail protein